MYDVYIENDNIRHLIHTDSIVSNKKDLKICNAKIVEGINTINSFSFEIFPNNPFFNSLFSYTTKVFVYNTKNDSLVFCGRVVKPKSVMDSDSSFSKLIECEDRLGYLRDTLMGFFPEQYWNIVHNTYDSNHNIVKRGVLEYVLGLHNSKQPPEKQIQIGEVTMVDDENNTLYFGMQQHMNAFDTIKEKLIEHIGGEIYLRETYGTLYLDYKEEMGEVKATEISIKKNIQKLSKETDPTTFITRLYPLGNKIKVQRENSDGTISEVETDERITCAVANNGIPYIDDEIGIQTYGIIEGYKIFDHVIYPQTLLNHGRTYLATNNKVKQKHVITALDLSLINLDIDSFEVGNYYPVKNFLLDVNDTLRVIKKTTNLNEPETSQLEIGDKFATLTELQLKRENSIKEELNQTMVTIQNNANYNIAKTENSLTSLINQFADRIEQMIKRETVSKTDFGEYKKDVSTKFTQTEDSFEYQFSNVLTEIRSSNGKIDTNQNELVKYIRFENGDIILGLVGNEILLRESHDRISFLQNNIEVAYFSNNKLYVTSAEFTNGLKVFDLIVSKEPNGSFSIG